MHFGLSSATWFGTGSGSSGSECGSGFLFDANADLDADPGYQSDADPDPQQSNSYYLDHWGRKRPKHSLRCLLKFTLGCVKRHCFEFNSAWWGWSALCWRLYTACLLHSIWDQIQNLRNCLTIPRQKPGMGRGLRQIHSCLKVLFEGTCG